MRNVVHSLQYEWFREQYRASNYWICLFIDQISTQLAISLLKVTDGHLLQLYWSVNRASFIAGCCSGRQPLLRHLPPCNRLRRNSWAQPGLCQACFSWHPLWSLWLWKSLVLSESWAAGYPAFHTLAYSSRACKIHVSVRLGPQISLRLSNRGESDMS